MRLAALACLLAAPALADVDSVLDAHILPGHARLAAQTEALAAAARADCAPEGQPGAYPAARDAWVQLGQIPFGPTRAARCPSPSRALPSMRIST